MSKRVAVGRLRLLGVLCLLLLPFSRAWAEAALVMRISTENTAEHVQTRALERFARILEEASGGRIQVQLYHSARLFRDRDVIAALIAGKVEMAVPGSWQLDRYVPDMGLYMLPLFYGRSVEEHHRVRDGKTGQLIGQRIERDLGVRLAGRWLDLGYANLYFTDRSVARHEDLAGMRIRVPGGVANQGRLRAFGADPVVVAWPDLPNALEQGLVRGVLTTHETLRSARLWRHGIRYCFEDREYFAQYVPMIRESFWQRLPAELQQLVADSWEQVVDGQRIDAARAQAEARGLLQRQGIRMVIPAAEALVHWRQVAREVQPRLVTEMGIDPQLVSHAEEALARP